MEYNCNVMFQTDRIGLNKNYSLNAKGNKILWSCDMFTRAM